jgi:hypothetical protein
MSSSSASDVAAAGVGECPSASGKDMYNNDVGKRFLK